VTSESIASQIIVQIDHITTNKSEFVALNTFKRAILSLVINYRLYCLEKYFETERLLKNPRGRQTDIDEARQTETERDDREDCRGIVAREIN